MPEAENRGQLLQRQTSGDDGVRLSAGTRVNNITVTCGPTGAAARRGSAVSYFRIVGIGAQAPEPIERIAFSATRAEVERSTLQRLCGKHGRVAISGKDGRSISPERLRRLAQDEAASDGHGDENPGAQA